MSGKVRANQDNQGMDSWVFTRVNCGALLYQRASENLMEVAVYAALDCHTHTTHTALLHKCFAIHDVKRYRHR